MYRYTHDISLSLSLSTYTYIYIYAYTCIYIYSYKHFVFLSTCRSGMHARAKHGRANNQSNGHLICYGSQTCQCACIMHERASTTCCSSARVRCSPSLALSPSFISLINVAIAIIVSIISITSIVNSTMMMMMRMLMIDDYFMYLFIYLLLLFLLLLLSLCVFRPIFWRARRQLSVSSDTELHRPELHRLLLSGRAARASGITSHDTVSPSLSPSLSFFSLNTRWCVLCVCVCVCVCVCESLSVRTYMSLHTRLPRAARERVRAFLHAFSNYRILYYQFYIIVHYIIMYYMIVYHIIIYYFIV